MTLPEKTVCASAVYRVRRVAKGALLTYPAKGCDCLYSYNKELNFHAQRVE